MKPVYQTTFEGRVGLGAGNCHSACLASVFELVIQDVPNFMETVNDDERHIQEHEWLRAKGFTCLCVSSTPETDAYLGLHIAIGPNARNGTMHSCVYWGNELLHDPNPAGGGLAEVEYRYVLVPLSPVSL